MHRIWDRLKSWQKRYFSTLEILFMEQLEPCLPFLTQMGDYSWQPEQNGDIISVETGAENLDSCSPTAAKRACSML